MENHPEIILHIDMDYFFAQCEEREHPEIKGKPVVICVYSGRGTDSGAVSTSNYQARSSGIKAGIPISRAKKLCPGAVFLPVNMELYKTISNDIMEILRGFSDIIEQESVDEAFLDITAKAQDFEAAKELAAKIKDEIKEKTKLTCSAGVGPNKLIAKIASDFQKPDGLTVVRPEKILHFLLPLKITDLIGVGKKTGDRLNELGIRTIGDLSGTSIDLIHEFGQARGIWLKLASHGIDDSPVVEREGTEQIGRIITLKEDTGDIAVIRDALDELSGDVHTKLAIRKLGFRSVTFVAISADFKTHTKSHTFDAPIKDIGSIKASVHQLARMFLSENPVHLRRIGIRLANLTEEKGQKTLEEF